MTPGKSSLAGGAADDLASSGGKLFRSFWMGGFECSSHINAHGVRLDMIAGVQHDRYAADDYRRLREIGLRTARDGLRWHLIDRGSSYDWSSWIPMLEAARKSGDALKKDIRDQGDRAIATMTNGKPGQKAIRLTVTHLDAAALAEWRKQTEAMYPQMKGKMVPPDLFDEVQRLRDECRARRQSLTAGKAKANSQ